jgi:hypothetical protein
MASLDPMKRNLDAAGLANDAANRHDVDGESAIVIQADVAAGQSCRPRALSGARP